jgi:hypothetical protein
MVEVKKEGVMKRFSTNYPGVYYRVVMRSGHPNKTEKMYYASYYKEGKRIETPIGRQYKDDMTPARASLIGGSSSRASASPTRRRGRRPPLKPRPTGAGGTSGVSSRPTRSGGPRGTASRATGPDTTPT